MSNVIIRIGKKVILFIALILITNLNLSAQYKLELEWQKKLFENITSITKSDNDSLIYVASANRIRTIRTSNGEVVKIDTVEVSYNLLMSRDGKTLAAAGNWGVGILDPQTFNRNYWDSVYSSDFRSLSFNEQQNKIVISGKSYVGKRETFIRIYDLNTKTLFKEFSPSYFGDIGIKNAAITDDGKYVIYGYETYTDQSKQHFFVKMIDIDGKLIKDFGETSSTNFSLTNDAKTLIYFDSKAMHFFDLTLMKVVEGIPIGGADPEHIEMSSDGKSMIMGYGNGLVYYDLETKKSIYLREFGTWRIFKLNDNKTSIFAGQSEDLYKFDLIPTTSIKQDQNKLDLKINIIYNKLILSNPQNHQINTLTAYDILGRTYPLKANGNEVDVSALAAGKYFLKVGLADGSFLDFSFVVE